MESTEGQQYRLNTSQAFSRQVTVIRPLDAVGIFSMFISDGYWNRVGFFSFLNFAAASVIACRIYRAPLLLLAQF